MPRETVTREVDLLGSVEVWYQHTLADLSPELCYPPLPSFLASHFWTIES